MIDYAKLEFSVSKSRLQEILELQGHIFSGQDYLPNHEIDNSKPCFCGRRRETALQKQNMQARV